MIKYIDYSTIKGAIFDMDGTLIDSMGIWEDIGFRYIHQKGIEPNSDIRDRLRPLSLLQAAEYLIKEYNLPIKSDEVMEQINNMVEDFYINEVKEKPWVKELLQILKDKGIKMCVATASNRPLAVKALERCELLDYFEIIFTCTEVGYGKDTPDIFIKAAEYLGTKPEETWVFEDAYHAIATAKKAGFKVVAVYDKSSEMYIDEIKELADVFLI